MADENLGVTPADEKEVRDVITAMCAKHGLELAFVTAICMVESRCNPTTVRFEKANFLAKKPLLFDAAGFAQRQGISPDTERAMQSISYGPMQIMGYTARWLGFKSRWAEMFKPAVSMEYACLYLVKLFKEFDPKNTSLTYSEAVASAYNGGTPLRDAYGRWINQEYVSRVKAEYEAAKTSAKLSVSK